MSVALLAVLEQQGNAPQTGQPHQRIDDTGEDRHLSAAEESDRDETKQADAAPGSCADGEDQCDLVDDHKKTS